MSQNSGPSITQQAIAAMKSGGSLDEVSTSQSAPVDSDEGTADTSPGEDSPDVDSMLGGNEGTDDEGAEDGQVASGDEPEDDSVVEADGKRYKVDYEDRKKIRKYVEMAAGMRKFQAERDAARKETQALKAQVSEFKGLMDNLKTAANDPGAALRILTGGKVDLDTLVQQRLERAKLREEATPEELQQLELHDTLAKEKARADALEARVNESLSAAQAAKDKAEVDAMKGTALPIFEKIRYAGKLGDKNAEHQIDELLWDKTMARLETYPEDVELTREIFIKEFKATRATLDKVVKIQTDQRVKKNSEERKVTAKETAQAQATRGNSSNSIEKDFATKVRSGNLKDILANFGKYDSVFAKKK